MPQAPGRARGARRRPERVREPLVRRSRRRRGGVLTDGPRILGFDPGSRRAGWAVVVGTAHRPELAGCGTIHLAEGPMSGRLAALHAAVLEIVARHAPTEAAVEAPFHGVSARSALQLAHARGVILAAVGQARIRVFEYAPATLKKAVTGNGRAEKEQVLAMVSRLVSGGATISGTDASDAVAAALCHLFTSAGAAARIGRPDGPSRKSLAGAGRPPTAW